MPPPIQRRLGVEEMVSVVVLHRWRLSPLAGSARPSSAKPLGSLHADGQFGREHAQPGADLAVEDLSKLEIVEFAQPPRERARQEQGRREPLRRIAGPNQRSLLFDEFADRQAVTAGSIQRRIAERPFATA